MRLTGRRILGLLIIAFAFYLIMDAARGEASNPPAPAALAKDIGRGLPAGK